MTADLREYISKLKKSKEIKIIKKKVSTKYIIPKNHTGGTEQQVQICAI